MEYIEPFLKVFSLVFLAEFGDKSQLVCMTLAARYRLMPVLLGGVAAFAFLNMVAVMFGAAVSHYLPDYIVFAVVGFLFLVFGIQAFRVDEDEDDEEPKVGRHLLLSVFILIFFAELGDKTQLSVAGMAAVENIWVVWVAGTVALAATTLLGVLMGRVVLQRLPILWVHRGAGVLFVFFALAAFWQLYLVWG
ncbi:TMEM165/GDT1 family protein [Neptuniibacter sp.]|uniref:TMEM165/GDT1 family protein n=1 Tax=Neptuniibacter sp. TaxID=1962643 RepID=UPI00261B1D75|nr:TMEM165/GDT1 family protein [Neptuniibacter sp.]MCP4597479.1 TMEM165/GDT1 family protein [Neptuniibacter sp.]